MQLNPFKWAKEPRKRPLPSDGFDLFRYRDYAQYRDTQVKANHLKLDWVSVKRGNIAFLADWLKDKVGRAPQFGLCHGTRQGLEQEWFREALPGCEVIGTEISDTASQFPHTVQWDFHEVKPEWLGAADFIYSNSFDHSFDPEKCINAWMSCLRPEGVCILEHGSTHEAGARAMDPFSARIEVMPYLLLKWAGGRFGVTEIVEAPERGRNDRLAFLMLRRFDRLPGGAGTAVHPGDGGAVG